MLRSVKLLAVAAAATLLTVSGAAAQMLEGARVLSPAAVADSQVLLNQLDARVRADQRDFVAWYHRGMVAWSLTTRARAANPPRELDATRLGRLADTSLRRAVDLAPDSALYSYSLGMLLLETGNTSARSAATGWLDKSAEAARKIPGATDMRLKAAIEAGQAHWRKYEGQVNRRTELTDGATIRSISEGAQASQKLHNAQVATGAPVGDAGDAPHVRSMKSVIEAYLAGTRPIPLDVSGEGDYSEAEQRFRDAYGAQPNDARAFRSVAMILAERNRWVELESFARQHLAKFPNDGPAGMSLGLATQRLGRTATAQTVFDSALRKMSPTERARIDRIQRVRPTADTSALERGTASQREAMQRLYWLVANPLRSRGGNVARTEMLARVTYAELRWTVDEAKVKGADTDKGNVYVRYGPPKTIGGSHPNFREGIEQANGGDLTSIWIYESGLMFVFRGQLTFATTNIVPEDGPMIHEVIENNPVRWDNVAIPTLDSLPMQFARFRATGDSVDVIVTAAANVESVRGPVGGGARADVWWDAANRPLALRDSLSLSSSRTISWAQRMPRDVYVVRAEVTADQSDHAATKTLMVDAGTTPATFGNTGFGLSDLLLASSALSTGARGERWCDMSVVPVADAVKANTTLALVWENYEFGAKDGQAQYEVVIAITPNRSLGGRIAASVVGALASAARIDRRDNRVTITLNRTAPHAPAFADQVSVSLQGTPPGDYTIMLQVRDRVTSQVLTRTRQFAIRQ